MKNIFLQQLLRLKEQAKINSDKQIAELFQMTAAAFNQRKKRESFPETELLALTARRPELKLDASYILTGNRVSDWERDVTQRTAAAMLATDPLGKGDGMRLTAAAAKSMGHWSVAREAKLHALKQALMHCEDADFAFVMLLAESMAKRLKSANLSA